MKSNQKEKAINLRKQGLSYSEILKQIPVAKSTLSLWLRSVGLSKKQAQRLTEKKLANMQKGALAKKNQRIALTQKIHKEAIKQIYNISKRDLFLIGVSLYWAEGSKEKENRPGSGTIFTNSDPEMLRLFIKWLTKICNIKKEDIIFSIYIHENSKNDLDKVKKYWSEKLDFPLSHFPYIYFKKNKIKTSRKNVGDSYFGLLKLKVKKSSALNRKIAGWIKGVIEYSNKLSY
ncbi:hypothetical protein COV23_00450 [Candidatus Wolfebacteria bacterium CG10_big_fil_rev_8_21_14_0_10_31_9]|uniref:Uncharacterized protein n=1 Tax=Candidatus Wolfebacteria bacterium CG10_big_fil_rev_8_21_14_0_10_31_9 TaxID=1975070 RepID=A0A2H0RD59_9BACT|nr:MAG: hypothetical protein COV23_00450 [Candidatus Wolfebacteria bacterium CG10_big_fil_rev_8_21_14_0_10_31_9]